MMEKIKLGVIFGGRSGEHEVSLMSARSVLNVISPEKYDVFPIVITREGEWRWGMDALQQASAGHPENLSQAAIFPDVKRRGLFSIRKAGDVEILEKVTDLDVVFPVLHGSYGEDGTLQGLLEMNDIAYVGAGVLGSSVGMDKGLFKDVMVANQIPVAPSLLVNRAEILHNMEDVVFRAEKISAYPLFVKPANMGSSVGVTKCVNRSDLTEGLLEASRFDRRVLIEHGVNAREIEVSVLGNDNPKASLPGEILPGADFYSYDAKYILDNSELIIPAQLSEDQTTTVRELAVKAYLAADCAGLARVDFLLDKTTGALFLNEINTIPGFTSISMYPKLWEATGISYAGLIDQLINLALQRKAERDATIRQYQREQ